MMLTAKQLCAGCSVTSVSTLNTHRTCLKKWSKILKSFKPQTLPLTCSRQASNCFLRERLRWNGFSPWFSKRSWPIVLIPISAKELWCCIGSFSLILSWQDELLNNLQASSQSFLKTKMMSVESACSGSSTRYLLCTKSQVSDFWKIQSLSKQSPKKRNTSQNGAGR